jgi:hypothetical protein
LITAQVVGSFSPVFIFSLFCSCFKQVLLWHVLVFFDTCYSPGQIFETSNSFRMQAWLSWLKHISVNLGVRDSNFSAADQFFTFKKSNSFCKPVS